jgi:hypothetical protein
MAVGKNPAARRAAYSCDVISAVTEFMARRAMAVGKNPAARRAAYSCHKPSTVPSVHSAL